jgi:hypothetical protein
MRKKDGIETEATPPEKGKASSFKEEDCGNFG